MADWSSERFRNDLETIERLLDEDRADEAVAPARALLTLADAGEEAGSPAATRALATAHWYLGRALAESGDTVEALTPLGEAHRLFEELAEGGHETAAAMAAACLTLTGDCLRDLDRLQEAADAYREAIASAADDPRGAAAARAQLAIVLILEEHFDEALAELASARATFSEVGEAAGLMAAWYNTGMAHRRASDLPAAERAYGDALALERELGDRHGEAETLAELGTLAHARGRLAEAVGLGREAAAIAAELEEETLEARARGDVAMALFELGRLDEARREIRRTIELEAAAVEEVSEPWMASGLLADVERAAGNAAAATAARERALTAYLAHRRAGGESQAPGREFLRAAVDALVDEEEEVTLKSLLVFREREDLPPQLRPLLEALSAILAGDHDHALAAHPDLSYMDAAELMLLLEALEDEEPS